MKLHPAYIFFILLYCSPLLGVTLKTNNNLGVVEVLTRPSATFDSNTGQVIKDIYGFPVLGWDVLSTVQGEKVIESSNGSQPIWKVSFPLMKGLWYFHSVGIIRVQFQRNGRNKAHRGLRLNYPKGISFIKAQGRLCQPWVINHNPVGIVPFPSIAITPAHHTTCKSRFHRTRFTGRSSVAE